VTGERDTVQLPPDLEAIRKAFWDRSVSDGVLAPLTDEMLDAAERSLGVRLPLFYVELLRVQNGGSTSPEYRAFATQHPTSWADDHVPFDDVHGIGRREDEYPDRGLLDNADFLEEWGIPDGLVLLSGDGHWWIALDYRLSGPRGEPSVCWVDNEVGELLELAPRFDDFVRGLRPAGLFEDDEEWDPDIPPEPGSIGPAALSGAIVGLESDLERLRAGERSMANTKAWCVERVSFVPAFLPEGEAANLAAALLSVEEATDEDGLAEAMTAVIREADALIPAWFEAQAPGYLADRAYLDERGELDRLSPGS
jgi:hypothetical protein